MPDIAMLLHMITRRFAAYAIMPLVDASFDTPPCHARHAVAAAITPILRSPCHAALFDYADALFTLLEDTIHTNGIVTDAAAVDTPFCCHTRYYADFSLPRRYIDTLFAC